MVGGASWLLIHEGRVGVALNPFLAARWRQGGSVLVKGRGWSGNPRAFGVSIPGSGWKPGFLLVPVYAPLVSKTQLEEREAFREQLSLILDHSSSRRRLVVGGDFNGEVGPTKDSSWRHVLGPYGDDRRTRGGEELLQFCEQEHLVVAGSFTPQRHKATWYHNRFGTAHTLDHFLVRGVDKKWIKSVFTVHFAANQRCSKTSRQGRPRKFSSAPWLEHTDHDPVELIIRVGKDWAGEAQRRRERAPRPDVLRFLGCSEEAAALRREYANVVSEELERVSGQFLDWDLVAEVMRKSAFQVVGPTPPRHRKPWLQGKESELLELETAVHVAEENLREARRQGSSQVDSLLDIRRRFSADLRSAKRRWEACWWSDLAVRANRAGEEGDDYAFWQVCRQLGFRESCRAYGGSLRTCGDAVREREAWKDFLHNIQSGEGEVSEEVWDFIPPATAEISVLGEEPTRQEFRDALRKMKVGKRGGADDITVEMIKFANSDLQDTVFLVVLDMWNDARLSDNGHEADKWCQSSKDGVCIPMYKNKGSKDDKNNYRNLVMLSVSAKIVARIAASRLSKWLETWMPEEQNGFRPGRGIDDVQQFVRRLLEEVSVSAKSACRRARAAESSGGTPGITWSYKVDGKLVRSGHARHSSRGVKSSVVGDVEFADDTALLGWVEELRVAEQLFVQTLRDWEQEEHRGKREKLMLVPGGRLIWEVLNEFEAKTLKHLGATHCDNADQWAETKKRVQAGFYAVKRVAKYWSLGTSHGRGAGMGLHTTKRLRVMRAVVEGTLLACGKSRVWSLAQERKANQVMARGIRRCLGVDRYNMREYGYSDEALRQMVQWNSFTTLMHRSILLWLGHVARMNCDRLPKMAVFGWMEGLEEHRSARYTFPSWVQWLLSKYNISVMAPSADPPAEFTSWRLFTDGAGPSPGAPFAGWGVAIWEASASLEPSFELFGPVCLSPHDKRFMGAIVATNNVGELSAMVEALLWLESEAPGPSDLPATIFYDSSYAFNAITGTGEPVENSDLVRYARTVFARVAAVRLVQFSYVKGHSGNVGNDKADELAGHEAHCKVEAAAPANIPCRHLCGKVFEWKHAVLQPGLARFVKNSFLWGSQTALVPFVVKFVGKSGVALLMNVLLAGDHRALDKAWHLVAEDLIACPAMPAADNVDARLEFLEDRVSEWDTLTRVRAKGIPALVNRAREIDAGTREFWTLKECVGQLMWEAVSPGLSRVLPADALEHVKTEWDVGFFKDGISGVYPIGGKWGETHIFDVRLKCGLQALRINHLIRSTVAPKMKEAGGDPNGPQLWVPRSQGEMRRKRARSEVIIFANWRGFSGGTRDMYNEILKFGAMIVDALVEYEQPIFIYIPKHGELRGGAWVVIDPAINPDKMEMYADVDARGGILEPPGIVEVKYRAPQQVEAMHRIDAKLKDLDGKLAGKEGAAKSEIEKEIKAREKQLLPLYTSVATTFADLHDRAGRMKAKNVIRDSIDWKNSRRYFFWRVKRRMLQDHMIKRLQKADPSLTHKGGEALIQKWSAESNVDFASDQKMVSWLESQNVDARAESIRAAYLKTQIQELFSQLPAGERSGLLSSLKA
ncbi:HFA1 [Symbiodinium sp. CCMP2592]|nr:HFA1 [Symbiodinium sp. CCMP2592]